MNNDGNASPGLPGRFFLPWILTLCAVICLVIAHLSPETVLSGLAWGRGTIATIVGGWFARDWFLAEWKVLAGWFALASILTVLWRRALERQSRVIAEVRPRMGAGIWLALSVVLVCLFDWPTLLHGFFRMDGFILIAQNRVMPLNEIVLLPHMDTLMPVYRLELAAMHTCFGVDPLPYNIALLSLFAGMLFTGVLFLRSLGVGRGGCFLFLLCVAGWTSWGEFTTGYYQISFYLQVACAAFLGGWALRRWQATGERKFAAVVLGAMAFACISGLVGFWVPPALCVLSVGTRFDAARWRDRLPPWLLGGGIALIAAVLALTMAQTGGLVRAQQALSFSVLVKGLYAHLGGGVILPSVAPGFESYLQQFGQLWRVIAVLVCLTGAGVVYMLLRLKREDRCIAVALLLVMSGTSLMVVLGRRFGYLPRFWEVKYTGVTFLWLACVAAFGWDRIWRGLDRGRGPFLQLTVFVVLLYLTAQTACGHAGGQDTKHIYRGRPYHLTQMRKRRAALTDLRTRFAEVLPAPDGQPLRIPTLDGNYLLVTHPDVWGYNLSLFREFVFPGRDDLVLLRNAAMESDRIAADVVTVDDLREATDPRFLAALKTNQGLRELYFAPALLRGTMLKAGALSAVYPRTDAPSASRTDWETLVIESPEFGTSSYRVPITLGMRYDFRQIYAFSLDPHAEIASEMWTREISTE